MRLAGQSWEEIKWNFTECVKGLCRKARKPRRTLMQTLLRLLILAGSFAHLLCNLFIFTRAAAFFLLTLLPIWRWYWDRSWVAVEFFIIDFHIFFLPFISLCQHSVNPFRRHFFLSISILFLKIYNVFIFFMDTFLSLSRTRLCRPCSSWIWIFLSPSSVCLTKEFWILKSELESHQMGDPDQSLITKSMRIDEVFAFLLLPMGEFSLMESIAEPPMIISRPLTQQLHSCSISWNSAI